MFLGPGVGEGGFRIDARATSELAVHGVDSVAICDECLDLCAEIIAEELG